MSSLDIDTITAQVDENSIKTYVKTITELQKRLIEKPSDLAAQKALALANKELNALRIKKSAPVEEIKVIKSPKEAIEYINGQNRKLGRDKFFRDVKSGKIRKQEGTGYFVVSELDLYATTLPYKAAPNGPVVEVLEERQRKKDEADIRLKEAQASMAEHKLAVQQGKYVLKSDVWLELAARAVALRNSLKNSFEARVLEMIGLVDGDTSKAEDIVFWMNSIFDDAFSEYAQPFDLRVDFSKALEEEPADEGE